MWEYHTHINSGQTPHGVWRSAIRCKRHQTASERFGSQEGIALAEDFDQTLNAIQEMMYQPGTFPETILFLYRKLLKRVEDEAPDMPAKDAAVRELTIRRDAFVAICYAMRMPKRCQRQALRIINNAPPERLAQFRRQIEAGAAESKAPLLLADLAAEKEVVPSALNDGGYQSAERNVLSSQFR